MIRLQLHYATLFIAYASTVRVVIIDVISVSLVAIVVIHCTQYGILRGHA
jgi:hypothetical protein